jgi:hypothetical protein
VATAKPIYRYVLDITTRKQAHNVNYTWAHLQTLGGKDDPPFCFGELYILQVSEVSMSNFVLLFDTWFLLHSFILLVFLCLLFYLYYVI